MILVIGAGRLGKLIIDQFPEGDITGSKTTPHSGSIKLDLNVDSLVGLKFDTYIFCIPPSALSTDVWIQRLNEVKDKKVILISSTGIYGENEGVVTEDKTPQPNTENGHKLFKIEKLLADFDHSFIIRPSGLYSEGSHPGMYLAGKKGLKNGNDPLNLIARIDVAKAVKLIYQLETPRLINLSNPRHPQKSIYYREYCAKYALELPHFENTEGALRVVSSKFSVLEDYTDLP